MENKVTSAENKVTSYIDRQDLFNRETLIGHIKAVGQRIIDDAERIVPDASYTRDIYISASISPSDAVTSVDYTISRIADPRVHLPGEDT